MPTPKTTSEIALESSKLMLEIIDHLKDHPKAEVLTALGAIVVYELDLHGETIEKFVATLHQLKAGREQELERQKREN